MSNDLLMVHSTKCQDEFCKASLVFELRDGIRVELNADKGIVYYPARCSNCSKEYKVKVSQPTPTETPTEEEWVKPTDSEIIADMALLVRRLAYRIRQSDPLNELARRSIDYVNEHVGKPTPLRNENENQDTSSS